MHNLDILKSVYRFCEHKKFVKMIPAGCTIMTTLKVLCQSIYRQYELSCTSGWQSIFVLTKTQQNKEMSLLTVTSADPVGTLCRLKRVMLFKDTSRRDSVSNSRNVFTLTALRDRKSTRLNSSH